MPGSPRSDQPQMKGTNYLTDSNERSPKLPAEYALQWFGAAPHPKMQEIAGVTDGFIRWIAENSGGILPLMGSPLQTAMWKR